jgi:putative heme transporter
VPSITTLEKFRYNGLGMADNHFIRRNWRMILTIITFTALVLFVYFIRDQIIETFQNLDNVNLWIILLMIPLQYGYYHFSAQQYVDLFRILGNKVSYRKMMRTTVELSFVNSVFPSGGVSGFSYFGLVLRGEGIRAARATIVQTMRFVLLFASFQLLLFFALFLLALDGSVNNFLLLIAGSLATLLIVGSGLFIYIISSRTRINNFFTFVTKAINKLIQVVRPKQPETINIERAKSVFSDYHDNYTVIKEKYKELRRPLAQSFMINLIEVLTIYVVFLAFGQWVNLGAVIIAYAVANFAGLISVLPGGIGIYEGLMIAVLVAGGVPAALSLPVIIMYRVLNISLQVPVGGILYYQRLHKDD